MHINDSYKYIANVPQVLMVGKNMLSILPRVILPSAQYWHKYIVQYSWHSKDRHNYTVNTPHQHKYTVNSVHALTMYFCHSWVLGCIDSVFVQLECTDSVIVNLVCGSIDNIFMNVVSTLWSINSVFMPILPNTNKYWHKYTYSVNTLHYSRLPQIFC